MTQSGADDFEQDFDEATLQRGPPPKASFAKNLSAAWQGSPLFKMFVLVVVVIAVTVAIIAIFSGPERDRTGSSVKGAPNLSDTPGNKAPPAYVEAVQDASIKRAEEALQQGKSAIPTPVSGDVSNVGPGDEADQSAYDPLAEFRPNIPADIAQSGQQIEEPVELIDSDLLGKMQQQMNALFDGWHPKGIAMLQVVDPNMRKQAPAVAATPAPGRVIVAAGSMYYGQMLMEANSDAPGPILAEILSGPFTGGRAIGQFEVTRDYLVIHFTKISYRKHDYNADILAVDPNTTLGALVSEKDNRYFTRVVLPTAAAFLEGFGQALSSPNQRLVNRNGDVIVLEQGRQGIEDGLYRGLSESMGAIGGFFREEAAATKPLIRVAVGTPMGLFFVNGVTEDNRGSQPIQTSINAQPVSSVNPVISGGIESGSGNPQSALANGGLNIIQSTPK